VALPGIPVGAAGAVREVGRLFITVEFGDGRLGYYAARQLAPASSPSGAPASSDDATVLGFTEIALPKGSHLCLLPYTLEESITVVAHFALAALRAGETCRCIVDPGLMEGMRSAIVALSSMEQLPPGALAFSDVNEVYLAGGPFTAKGQLDRLHSILDSCEGQEVRLYGGVSTALQQIPAAEWWKYEREATKLLRSHGITAMCGYTVGNPSGEQWKYARATHPYVVMNRELSLGGQRQP